MKTDIVLKDKNFNFKIALEDNEKSRLLQVISNDVEFLCSFLDVMDYSLLLAIEKSKLKEVEPSMEVSIKPVVKSSNQIHPLTKKAQDCQLSDVHESPKGVHILESGHQRYYIGIIDIFTQYDTRQKIGRVCKTLKFCSSNHSSLPPRKYAKRFLEFIQNDVFQ